MSAWHTTSNWRTNVQNITIDLDQAVSESKWSVQMRNLDALVAEIEEAERAERNAVTFRCAIGVTLPRTWKAEHREVFEQWLAALFQSDHIHRWNRVSAGRYDVFGVTREALVWLAQWFEHYGVNRVAAALRDRVEYEIDNALAA